MAVAEKQGRSTGQVGPLGTVLMELSRTLARCQHQLVQAAAEFAESAEWLLAGSPTASSWLATVADVEESTAREWIRIVRYLAELPAIGEAFRTRGAVLFQGADPHTSGDAGERG